MAGPLNSTSNEYARKKMRRLRKKWKREAKEQRKAELAAMTPEERNASIQAKRAATIARKKAESENRRNSPKVLKHLQKQREIRIVKTKIKAAKAVEVELARRELARRNLLAYVMRSFPAYQAGWVHKDICARLQRFSEDVVAGKSPRLILTMPPRHGKSFIASERFPAWHLGNNPDHDIISCSYSSPLAMSFSRKVQEQIRSKDYHLLFKTAISRKNESVENWATTEGGNFLAAGVGGPITGRGANILLIDDPIKNREEAESQTQRQAIIDWYTSTAYTRLMPGAGVMIILTRWHHGDLAGWLLDQMEDAEKELKATGVWPDDHDCWEVVNYPAIATEDENYRKKGEALHEARYPLHVLKKIRRTIGRRDWNALYMQTPTAEEGDYFTKDTFRWYTQAPASWLLNYYAAGDLAISKKEHADWTVFLVVGIDAEENLYIVDMRRGQWDSAQITDQIFELHKAYKPKRFGIEKGHISMAMGPYLNKRIQETRTYDLVIEELAPGKRDKELRARPIQGRMRQGKVFLPENAPWTQSLVNELLRFPNGVNDDIVDALAWIGQMLQDFVPPAPKNKKKKSFRDTLNNYLRPSEKANSHMAA